MYHLTQEAGEITLQEQDGSGYLVRCCGSGEIETRVVCASGDISEPVKRTPEAFLHHHPDAAAVPGIGAALFKLVCSGAPTNGDVESAPPPPRMSTGHLKPVLRNIRR